MTRRGAHVVTDSGEYITDPLANLTRHEATRMSRRDPLQRGTRVVAPARPLSLSVLKRGVAAAVDAWSLERLVAHSPQFRQAWETTAMVPGSFGELNAAAMFSVLESVRPARVVEIGSYLGRSTVFFASTLKALGLDGEVVAIDPHTGDRQQMEALGVERLPSLDLYRTHIAAARAEDVVRTIVARSEDAAKAWDEPIDFLYIDGWHSYDAVLADGRSWLPHLTSGGAVFFDDYGRYDEVRRAVDQLADEGTFRLWGNSFGQAFGGKSEPSPGARRVAAAASTPLARRLHRPR